MAGGLNKAKGRRASKNKAKKGNRTWEPKARKHKKVDPFEQARLRCSYMGKDKKGKAVLMLDYQKYCDWLLKYFKSNPLLSMHKGYCVGANN